MAMAAVGPYTSGAQMVAASNTAGTMMRHNRNESSADSLVAMLAPHVGLQGERPHPKAHPNCVRTLPWERGAPRSGVVFSFPR